VISLVGIPSSGLVVLCGFLTGKRLEGLTTTFLTTTVLTSLTGFGFPFDHLLPSHKVGILLLLVLAAIPARYVFDFSGAWRWVFVVGATTALYFNVFVFIVQAFEKAPVLKALVPTQTEHPLVIAQSVAFFGVPHGYNPGGKEISPQSGTRILRTVDSILESKETGRFDATLYFDVPWGVQQTCYY
jgi:hypothetical protein